MKDKEVFSDEIIKFSKLVDKSFDVISDDIKKLNLEITDINKSSIKLNKDLRNDVDNIKKEMSYLKSAINQIKKSISVLEVKVKKTNTNELNSMDAKIKNIERKLKIN